MFNVSTNPYFLNFVLCFRTSELRNLNGQSIFALKWSKRVLLRYFLHAKNSYPKVGTVDFFGKPPITETFQVLMLPTFDRSFCHRLTRLIVVSKV